MVELAYWLGKLLVTGGSNKEKKRAGGEKKPLKENPDRVKVIVAK